MTESIRDQLAREAAEAERELDELDNDAAAPAPVRARQHAKDPSQVYSVRIPVAELSKLRELADQRGETPSGLLRRWALERLAQETSESRSETDMERIVAGLVVAVDKAVAMALVKRGLLDPPNFQPELEDVDQRYLDPSGPVRLGDRRLWRSVEHHSGEVVAQ